MGEKHDPDTGVPLEIDKPKALSSEAFFGSRRSQDIEAAIQRLLCWGSGYHFLLPEKNSEQRRRRADLLQRRRHVWKVRS